MSDRHLGRISAGLLPAALCLTVAAPASSELLGVVDELSFEVAPAEALVLDFDTDGEGNEIVHGQIVDEAYEADGVSIQVVHPTLDWIGVNIPIVLDTAVSIEADMRTGEFGAYGPGNTEYLGNVLIIPRNNWNFDDNPDVYEVPDTAFERPNGMMIFNFEEAIYMTGMVTVLDSEEPATPEANVGVIQAFRNGVLLGTTVIPAPGDNSVQVIGLPEVDTAFDQLVFTLAGSSGIDNLTLNPVPEPATAALLGLGGLAMLRRRSA